MQYEKCFDELVIFNMKNCQTTKVHGVYEKLKITDIAYKVYNVRMH